MVKLIRKEKVIANEMSEFVFLGNTSTLPKREQYAIYPLLVLTSYGKKYTATLTKAEKKLLKPGKFVFTTNIPNISSPIDSAHSDGKLVTPLQTVGEMQFKIKDELIDNINNLMTYYDDNRDSIPDYYLNIDYAFDDTTIAPVNMLRGTFEASNFRFKTDSQFNNSVAAAVTAKGLIDIKKNVLGI